MDQTLAQQFRKPGYPFMLVTPIRVRKTLVYIPHIEDAAKVLRAHKLLERMNVFLQLMHAEMTLPANEVRTINTEHEFATRHPNVPQVEEHLKTAVPAERIHLSGLAAPLAADPALANAVETRFSRLAPPDLADIVMAEFAYRRSRATTTH